jgi:hypothetical protein
MNAMKRFDEKFADNVREAFDGYDEQVDPAAWAAMQGRLKRRRKARIIPFSRSKAWAAVAATVFLAVAGWLFFEPGLLQPHGGRQPMAVKESPEPAKDLAPLPATPTDPAPVAAEMPAISPEPAQPLVRSTGPAATTDTSAPLVAETTTRAADDEMPAVVAQQQLPPETNEEVVKVPEVVLPRLRPAQDAGAAALAAVPPDPFRDFESKARGGQSWSVAAGSMLAFAEQRISDGLGVTAGVVSEWKVSPRITLSAAGMLAYHQFELVNFGGSRFAADYLDMGSASGDVNVLGRNQFEMLALDIPLNAQLDVMDTDRRRLFLGAGFSSVLFLQQRFTGNNRVFYYQQATDPETGAVISVPVYMDFTADEQYEPFSRFDLARLLNLSVGYVIKAEKGAYVIEPFMKYPLGSITSRDIRLGMGGISLRYNFSRP